MAFGRIVVAFLGVSALLLAWRELERRLRGTPGDAGPALRAALPPVLVEALLLTLFAALWFGSLGSGGAWLLFPLVGLLIEVPARLRSHPVGAFPWKPVAGAVLRILLAGLLLGWVMT
jgi:hypothetical protein